MLLKIKEVLRDIASVLKYPVLLGLFALEAFTVLLAFGVALVTLQHGIFTSWLSAAASWALMNSPIIYKVWRKIREEDSKAKIMQEGWEGNEDTTKAVREYQDLLKKQRHKK